MDSLQGRRALVGGASRGIGRACAEQLANLGAAVTLVARDAKALKDVAGNLNTEAGQTHDYICADSSDPAGLQQAVDKHVRAAGAIHILVNNTGGPPAGALLDASSDDLAQAFSNHVLCFQRLAQSLVPGMKAAGFGRIINVISTSVLLPIRGLGVSNTIRGAVANWGKTLAMELAPFGITVNNVLPGFVDTDRLRAILRVWAKRDGVSSDEVAQRMAASVPIGRFADPREFAAVVGFLACPAASYVTGVNLPIDGGRTIGQ